MTQIISNILFLLLIIIFIFFIGILITIIYKLFENDQNIAKNNKLCCNYHLEKDDLKNELDMKVTKFFDD